MDFFDSLSDHDKLATEITKLIYKKRYSKPVRLLSFSDGSNLKPFQDFLTRHVLCKKKDAEENARFFKKRFSENCDKDVVKFRNCLEKKIKERYELGKVDYSKFRFYIDEDYEETANNPTVFNDDSYTDKAIEDFMEKIQFTFDHPPLDTFMDELKKEMKKVCENCDTTFIINSLLSDVVTNLSKKSSEPYTKECFDSFLSSFCIERKLHNIHHGK